MQTSRLDQETDISATTKQAVNGRDDNGRFAADNKPTVEFTQTQKGGATVGRVKKIEKARRGIGIEIWRKVVPIIRRLVAFDQSLKLFKKCSSIIPEKFAITDNVAQQGLYYATNIFRCGAVSKYRALS